MSYDRENMVGFIVANITVSNGMKWHGAQDQTNKRVHLAADRKRFETGVLPFSYAYRVHSGQL